MQKRISRNLHLNISAVLFGEGGLKGERNRRRKKELNYHTCENK